MASRLLEFLAVAAATTPSTVIARSLLRSQERELIGIRKELVGGHNEEDFIAGEWAEYGDIMTSGLAAPALIGDPSARILFIKTYEWPSALMRADSMAWILNNLTGGTTTAASLSCETYVGLFCDSVKQTAQVVVHVKFVCSCSGQRHLGALGAKHIFDPVDGPATTNGGFHLMIKERDYLFPPCDPVRPTLSKCFFAFFVQNNVEKRLAEDADAKVNAYVLQHHHLNFHDRLRPSFPNLSMGVGASVRVGIAGHSSSSIPAHHLNLDLSEVEGNGCPPENMLEPCPSCDCYATNFQQLTLGVAWNQECANTPQDGKSIDNSAQRLLNLFSAGVPAIGHSNYASYREVVEGYDLLQPTNDSEALLGRLQHLASNPAEYRRASEQALEVAKKYSPMEVGRRYLKVIDQL